MMIARELPLVICLLSGLSNVEAQYGPGPIRVGVPVKLGPTGNFVTAFNFEDFLSSAPPKQYVATVLTNNEAISISPPNHALPSSHQQSSPSLPGKHREDYGVILNKQSQLQDYARPAAVYAASFPQENTRGSPHVTQTPHAVGHAGHIGQEVIQTHGPVSSDGTIQLPKERVSVSSFTSMQAAKDTFGEQIKLDPKKFRKELDNVEWREEIVFPRPGPARIKWNPKTYTEDERIVKARNNRYVYAEFRDGSEVDDALEQTGRSIPPKVKPSLNSGTAHAIAQYDDPNKSRQLKTYVSKPAEQQNPHGKVVYEQQHFRVKEEEQLRSQFGYTGRANIPASQDHEVRYYPTKHTGDRESPPPSDVDYERAFRQEPQLKSQPNAQFSSSSGPRIPEEDPRPPRSGAVEYGTSDDYRALKSGTPKHQKDDENTAGLHQVVYDDDGNTSDSSRLRGDAHVYRQGRQNRHQQQQHRYQEDEPEHDERLVYRRKVPKYVTQGSVGKASRGDLDGYSRHSEHSSLRKKEHQHRHEYRPDPDSEEVSAGHVQGYAARSEDPRYVKAPKYTSDTPKKYAAVRNTGGGTIRYKKKKKKPVYYDDDEEAEEAEQEEKRPRRFNIRFENNPGEPFSFRKDNRKGDSVEDVDDTEEAYEDRVSLYPRSVLRSLRAGSEAGEGGVNLSFRLA